MLRRLQPGKLAKQAFHGDTESDACVLKHFSWLHVDLSVKLVVPA